MDADNSGVELPLWGELREWESYHPRGGDLYTPWNEDVVELLNRMRDVHGSWREVSYLAGTRLKVLYRMRTPALAGKVVSMKFLDRLITATGVGELWAFTWFTADDLVALGIWDAPGEPLDTYPEEWKRRHKRRRH